MIKEDKKFNYFYVKFINLAHHERLILLILGWVVIYGIWHFFFANPLVAERQNLKDKIVNSENEINQKNVEIGRLLKPVKKIEEAKSLDKDIHLKNPLFVDSGNRSSEQLIKQFFNLENEIKSINLRSNIISPTSFGLQAQFNSGYFETMAYLVRLEQLPWCLSWDSLSYQVNIYPEASIAVSLHTEIS